jgi:membrane dipeptidase
MTPVTEPTEPRDQDLDVSRSLHDDAVVIDTHNDLLMLVVNRPVERWGGYFRERWLPQLRDGGIDVQVLPIFIDDPYQPEGALRHTLRMAEAAHRIAEENADEVALCRDGGEIDRALEEGKVALVLALEGCPQIGPHLELLSTFTRLGVRMVSLVHFGRTALADGSAEDAAGSRLTSLGVAAVAELERLGALLDISHLGKAGVDHVLEIATRPIIASHSSARALHDHHRNLSDAHLKGVAAGGGVVCVNFFPGFVGTGEPTVAEVVDHLEHVAGVAGIEHTGIGPDFIREVVDELYPAEVTEVADGLDPRAVIPGLEGPAGLPSLTAELVRRGWDDEDITRVLGGNVLRLLRAELGVPAGERGRG